MREQLSLCMIVKDEERELPRCLDSVRSLAREFIVVDTGSTDATIGIAARYGARVVSFDFSRVDFAAARNHAIAHATGQWILMLDADEMLVQPGAPQIEALVDADLNAGYFFERRNHAAESGTCITDYAVRLFPNRPNYRFRGRVHETVDASILAGGGRLERTAIRLDHKFSAGDRDRRQRNQWYIRLLEEEIAADPTDVSRLDFLAAEYHQLEMFDEATQVAERIAGMRPSDHRAHLLVGIYHLFYKPDRARARADFEKALQLRPGFAEAESFLRIAQESGPLQL